MIIFQCGNKYLAGFNLAYPIWVEDKEKAKKYPKDIGDDIKSACYQANPDSEIITEIDCNV